MQIHQAGANPKRVRVQPQHKHLPEMAMFQGEQKTVFCPAVGSFGKGMVVSVPLHYDQLAEAVARGRFRRLSRRITGEQVRLRASVE